MLKNHGFVSFLSPWRVEMLENHWFCKLFESPGGQGSKWLWMDLDGSGFPNCIRSRLPHRRTRLPGTAHQHQHQPSSAQHWQCPWCCLAANCRLLPEYAVWLLSAKHVPHARRSGEVGRLVRTFIDENLMRGMREGGRTGCVIKARTI